MAASDNNRIDDFINFIRTNCLWGKNLGVGLEGQILGGRQTLGQACRWLPEWFQAAVHVSMEQVASQYERDAPEWTGLPPTSPVQAIRETGNR